MNRLLILVILFNIVLIGFARVYDEVREAKKMLGEGKHS